MDVKFLLPYKYKYGFLTPQIEHTHMYKPMHVPFRRSVMIEPIDNVDASSSPLSVTPKNVYNDNCFHLVAINHLSNTLQATTGVRSNKNGYDGLVEAAKSASRIFNASQQQQHVVQTLQKALPGPLLFLIRRVLPPSQFAREHFAVFTTIFFTWLVGPCEVRESEFDGRRENNVVHIKKCRFLEETNCIGMCTNLCKFPSQLFLKDSLAMPLNMVPNFDDMSCEMIFGEEPPLPTNDPVLLQPCYKICKTNKRHQNKDEELYHN